MFIELDMSALQSTHGNARRVIVNTDSIMTVERFDNDNDQSQAAIALTNGHVYQTVQTYADIRARLRIQPPVTPRDEQLIQALRLAINALSGIAGTLDSSARWDAERAIGRLHEVLYDTDSLR